MQYSQLEVAVDLSRELDRLYLKFGARKIAYALLAAVWKRRREPSLNDLKDLPYRLRRDIGLVDAAEGDRPDWENFR